ncbi:hypothetical protein [Nonomuraea harbinensis]|uniref:Uncharacterized protein n=1 Tax=Nonomuraea harbinensis TaxID=1286938 RepID=A0ABW1BS17_9ACTN|nr:hypothetical protein [Nonomuraea harbinensis]
MGAHPAGDAQRHLALAPADQADAPHGPGAHLDDGAADHAAVSGHQHAGERGGGDDPDEQAQGPVAGEDAAQSGGDGEEQQEREHEGCDEGAESPVPDPKLFHKTRKRMPYQTSVTCWGTRTRT